MAARRPRYGRSVTTAPQGVRPWWAALLCIVVVAGCGGESEPQSSTAAKPAEPTPDGQVSREVKKHADRVAATMRRLGDALDLADCDQARRITRLRDRMLVQARALTAYRTEPAFRDDLAGVQGTVDELDTEIDGLLRDCREQRELERTADEANRLADEIEAQAAQP